jgi:putative multiple sugar transport system substrate-binding protein
VRKTLTGLATIGLVLSLAACGSEEMAVKSNMGATIGISMPTTTSPRWVADSKNMKEQFTSMGYKVEVKFAENDVKTQVATVKKFIADGDKLLVISAVDAGSLVETLADAKAKGVKVIAYDRLITKTPNVDYQATFDNVRVGVMQAQLLIDKLNLTKASRSFNVELYAGSSTDVNAKSFYDGAMQLLKPYIASGKIKIPSGKTKFSTIATKDYSGDIAGARMKDDLNTYYKNRKLDAVLSPYDGMTRGIIKALKAGGYGTPENPMPINSGQDAEADSMKMVISGEQTATIYKDTRELAKVAVQQGNALLTGTKPMVNDTTSFNNGVKAVPTYLLYPIAVDKTNYQTLLVDGGYYTKAQLS